MPEEDNKSRFVTVFHQIKETENGDVGDRLVALGQEVDDRYIFDEETGEFIPYASPIALINIGAEITDDELNDWCNSHAGKAVLKPYFPTLELIDDPTLPDSEEYLEADCDD